MTEKSPKNLGKVSYGLTGGANICSNRMGRSHHVFEQLLHRSLGSSQEKENGKAKYAGDGKIRRQ